MLSRYKLKSNLKSTYSHLKLFVAVKEVLNKGYAVSDFRADLMSGLVVALIAIPLGMALAIASGVPPQYGLYTVIIGGSIVALLGGSRLQVTGPTAAFVVILLPIVHKFGLSGLLVAGFLAGVILIIMGVSGMGRLIQFIPYPVTTGFTSGIAVVIATLQLKDFLGLKILEMPDAFINKASTLVGALGTASLTEFTIGFLTLMTLILWPKLNKRIPAPLVALFFAAAGVAIFRKFNLGIDVATIGSQFSFEIDGIIGHGIPQALPVLQWPWNFTVHNGSPFVFSIETIQAIVPSAFAIAMLGAIESLLSAVVADGMAKTKHDPDAELVALGIGNLVCPFFGGIPATGAIARTATNIRYGAKSPFSSLIHSLFTLVILLLFAPYVSYLPMAALSALLIVVAFNMSEYKHFIHIVKVAPKSDVIVLLTCFFLTVVFDMVVGVTVGVLFAALLFMRRMADLTESHQVENKGDYFGEDIPDDIIVYEIEGPMFFGAAEKAAKTLTNIGDDARAVIFILSKVPIMDVTGLVALEGAIGKLTNRTRKVCLVGLSDQPKELISKSPAINENKNVIMCMSIQEALNYLSKP